MKRTHLILTLFAAIVALTATAQQPFEKYGYKAKVVTLSQGKYEEFFDQDTLVQIGSVIMNRLTGKILSFVEYDTLYSEATLEPQIISRWLQPDPHAENYYSWSPYNYAANNPIVFIDPDGRDIKFYSWSKNDDDEWERKEVAFGDLDENVQKALEAFAKTEEGNAFLSQFASEGDKVGSVEFTKDGEFSKHEMGFDQFKRHGSAFGTSGYGNTKESVQFYMKINIGRSEQYQTPESYATTVGHEAFIHLKQYDERLMKAIENKDVKAYYAIVNERRKIARDRNGGPDHDGYVQGKPEFSRMKNYMGQLKKVLNPTEVNKQLQKHDKKLGKTN